MSGAGKGLQGALLSMHDVRSDSDARADIRRRWKWLAVLSVATLLLHAAALSGLEWAWPARAVPPLPAVSVQVRVVEPAPPMAAAVAMPVAAEPAPVMKTVLRSRAQPAPARVAAQTSARAPSAATATPAPATDEPTGPVQLALNTAAASPNPAAEVAAGDEAIPHYRTRMPPATTLRYEMHRGLLRGTGDLSWRPQGDHYELRLDAKVAGLPVLTQASTGGFDDSGMAPVRFTDQRLRRSITAANFQRAAGKITFSGPATEFALRAGAQDRLSWMVQLAAIVAADPQLSVPGAKVAMYVVGSHGDGGVWVFRCIGPETVSTGAGAVDAIKFTREPREAYDTTVQVWLDPHQHDLPVRATQKSGPSDEGFELRLLEVVPSN
jgi:Protein of unknown function (DUF3108)